MTKHAMMSSLVFAFASALSTTSLAARNDAVDPAPSLDAAASGNMRIDAISEEAFILKSAGIETNIGLIKTSMGVVLIDPMPGSEHLDALDRVVKELTGESASIVLNTHEHDDHTGGNAYFIERGARLPGDSSGPAEIQQVAARSHTHEDKVFFHRNSNIIFVGDIYDTYWHPTFYAGGLSGFDDAIDTILALGDEESLVVPGHGRPTSKTALRAFRKNTFDWASRVRELKNRGMTAVDISSDAKIVAILERFNHEKRAEFIPERAFLRFIERTLAVIEKGV